VLGTGANLGPRAADLPRDPRVATIVLNYRHIEDSIDCVAALLRSTVLDQRIVVVDNGPEGAEHDRLKAGIAAVTAPATDVTVVATGANLGYAGGNNAGIRLALQRNPEFLWIVNPDLRVEPTTLERLLAAARAVPDAAALAPRILHGGTEPAKIWFDGGVVDRSRGGAVTHVNMGRIERDTPPTPPRDVAYVTGACMLLRADAVRALGTIPEDYFLYFEETDYCQRLIAGGWRVVVDSRARAVHHKRARERVPTPAVVYYMRRNRVLFAKRLGLNPADAVEEFDGTWVRPWRRNVSERVPHWLPTFDALIARAAADADTGVSGPADLGEFPDAEPPPNGHDPAGLRPVPRQPAQESIP
jgi:GT2 family glycosyltransferase